MLILLVLAHGTRYSMAASDGYCIFRTIIIYCFYYKNTTKITNVIILFDNIDILQVICLQVCTQLEVTITMHLLL